jgi:hypothetical protein
MKSVELYSGIRAGTYSMRLVTLMFRRNALAPTQRAIRRRALSRPPCGGGPGWGVAPNSNRGVVEARPQLREPRSDRLEHAIEIAEHVLVREAQNVVPLVSERGRTGGVAGDLLVRRVRGPVDFDNHPRVEAGEVGDEAAEDHLATEAEARDLLAPQALPQASLGAGRMTSEVPREMRQSLRHGATPHPVPPPQGGRGRAIAFAGTRATVVKRLSDKRRIP